jgi:hypothetical protein
MGQGISILFPQLGMYDFGLAVKKKKNRDNNKNMKNIYVCRYALKTIVSKNKLANSVFSFSRYVQIQALLKMGNF